MNKKNSNRPNTHKNGGMKQAIQKSIKSDFVVVLLLFIVSIGVGVIAITPTVDKDTFTTNLVTEEDVHEIASFIYLRQTIVNPDTLEKTYRYKFDTDCDQWSFEGSYITTTPLEWVTDETSSVPLKAIVYTVEYDGILYAQQTYYYIHEFGVSQPVDVDFGTWKETIQNQAYNAYRTSIQASNFDLMITHSMLGVVVLLSGAFVYCIKQTWRIVNYPPLKS